MPTGPIARNMLAHNEKILYFKLIRPLSSRAQYPRLHTKYATELFPEWEVQYDKCWTCVTVNLILLKLT